MSYCNCHRISNHFATCQRLKTVGTWPFPVLHGAFLFRQFFLSLKDIIPCLSGMPSWWTSTMCGLHSWELGVALSASLASSETTSLGWFKHLNDSGSYLIHIIFVLFLSIFNCLNGSLWCDQVNKPALSGVMFCKGMFGRRSGEEKVLSMSGKGPGFPQRKLTEQKHVGALGNRLAGQWWRRHLIIQTNVIKRSVHLLQIPDYMNCWLNKLLGRHPAIPASLSCNSIPSEQWTVFAKPLGGAAGLNDDGSYP